MRGAARSAVLLARSEQCGGGMSKTFKFNETDINNLNLDQFAAFLAANSANGQEPAPGSLSVLAPRRPGDEALGLHDPQVRDLYCSISARFPKALRWIAAGKFTKELILAGISGLRVSWSESDDCPHIAYPGAAEAARWGEIEGLAFPELVSGGVVDPLIEGQWRDLHREF